ncbi:MAG: icmX [Gammaproteobacteria bacterium]|nr:icmX [Gammaproteobacteria bacterium]
MKKRLLQCVTALAALTCAFVMNAAPTANGNLADQKSALQSQAANTQNATNSLIRWLNANLVTGTPLEFPQSMKANLQNILANHNINNLDWELTRAITFIALKGQAPTDQKTQNAIQTQTSQNNIQVQASQTADINTLNTQDTSDLVPKSTDTDKTVAQKLAQFNIGKLLSTNTIAPKSIDNKNALILMQFVSGLADSVGPLSPDQVKRNNGPINTFQQQYGVYVAQQSVGVNTLFSLLDERLVQKGLGTQLGGPQADMSPLALDQFMATRRLNVNDANGWLAQLSNATPAQVAKEQLMLMAEMRYEMYLTRRSLENIQTLIAVQELQSNDLKKNALQKLQADVSSANLPGAIN